MAEWVNLHFRARHHAATEPNFRAARHLETVALHGGHLGYCLALGLDLATPEGRAAANFHAALIIFCYDLCAQGVGHLQYNPAPLNLGPLGAIAAGPAVGGPGGVPAGQDVGPPPDVDDGFVEIIGGVDPVNGPWAVDHDFVEIVGGVDPIHGPWVEGGPPVGGGALHAADIQMINEIWQELFGVNGPGNEPDDQGNAPVN
jgi:hypothetical protein